jgi:hypothetical protein
MKGLKDVLAGMLAVGFAFATALPLAFWLRPRYPHLSDDAFAILVVGLLVAISFAAMMVLRKSFRRKRIPGPPARTSGYEVTFDDFRRLLGDPSSQPEMARLLGDWFGYQISGQGDATAVRSAAGHAVGLRALHAGIQAEPEKQRAVYSVAMYLWR